jgi:ankyrin repeat protein
MTNQSVDEKKMMEVVLVHDAARDGDIEKIKTLFKNAPEIIEATDQKGMTPLHIAVVNRRLTVAQTLLDLHANANARSSTDQTPLHIAARNGDVAMTALLLKNRAQADARDRAGATPLWITLQSPEAEAAVATDRSKRKPAEKAVQWAALAALEKRQFELASLLVQARADVKTANRSGGTPLTQAVRIGNASVVELLLKAGADPNAVEPASGMTALHLAASRADSRLVDLLLRSRATVNPLDNRGETPLAFAMREGRTNSIAALRAAGGELPRLRALNAAEQSLVDAYQKNEAALQRAGTSEKGRLIVALNPTQADCKKMFPQHAASAWTVVSQLNSQIKEAFSKPLVDAEGGRESWRILPERPAVLTREWQARGWLTPELPIYSLSVDKVGSATRPGEYCFVNGHWVLLPPLYRIAAEYASANQRPGK